MEPIRQAKRAGLFRDGGIAVKTYFSDGGLLVDNGRACGYLFNFKGHGAFEPSGRVQLQNGELRDLTQAEIDTHNRILAEAEILGLDGCEVGQWGTLFWSRDNGVITWTGLKVADYTLNPQQTVLTFERKGKVFRGRLQKDADCFNFKRIK